jgi:hypothetical protein
LAAIIMAPAFIHESGQGGRSFSFRALARTSLRFPCWTQEVSGMATAKQRSAARRNIKKAAAAARKKRTISKLPKSTRTALGKQANKKKREKAAKGR